VGLQRNQFERKYQQSGRTYWNEIAQTASIDRYLTTAQNARLFALLNFSVADGVIAFYDGNTRITAGAR